MMRKRILLTTTAFLLLASTAAGAGLAEKSGSSNAPTANAKGSSPRGIKAVVAANNGFAFDLYSELAKSEKGNIFYSPYSISAALAMTYEGARGKTAAEMKSVFHFPKKSVLRPNFAALFNGLTKTSNKYRLQTGNALWVQKQFPLLKKFTKSVRTFFGGKAKNLDFVNKTEQSRRTINRYIASQTNNKIKNLIPARSLDSTSRFVLTNAIYFKGAWRWEFDPRLTYQGDFTVAHDNVVKTPMMFMSSSEVAFNYAANSKLQILELPYKGNKVSMLLLLPQRDLGSIKSYLTARRLNKLKAQMRPTLMDWIALPKFEFDCKYQQLDRTLAGMGMPSAFSARADFSGMNGKRNLFIRFIIHQAYVKVDEKGTEATGATAVGGNLTAIEIPKIFNANHPFVFVIQDKTTGNILFLGKVANPKSSD